MMTYQFYIATTLTNAARARQVADQLEALGHTITYPWWTHGAVGHAGEARLAEVAVAELEGVRLADAVIVLLPGGRGTHLEMGGALVAGKPVLLWSEDDAGFPLDDTTCSFYWHPLVFKMHGRLDELINLQVLALQAAELVRQREAGAFGFGRHGHAAAIAAVLDRPVPTFPLIAVIKRSGRAVSAYVQGVPGCAVTGPTLPTVLGRLGQAVEQQLAEAV
jgi:hypothetical protein